MPRGGRVSVPSFRWADFPYAVARVEAIAVQAEGGAEVRAPVFRAVRNYYLK